MTQPAPLPRKDGTAALAMVGMVWIGALSLHGGNETPRATERRPYEPPHLRDLGTLQELTQGNAGGGTDGINPGSLLGG